MGPYEIEVWCLDYEEADELIRTSWTRNVVGSASFVLQRKLKHVKNNCKNRCIQFKDENNIRWAHMNNELIEAQKDLCELEKREDVLEMTKQVCVSRDLKLKFWK